MSIELEREDYELEEEEEESLPTFEHSIVCANIITELRSFLKGKNLGRVAESSVEYRFLDKKEGAKKKPGKQPDVSFVRQEKLPSRFRSYPDVTPDLVVEVESPSDKPYLTEAKISEYQQAGVKLVWVVHPFSRTIDIYRLSTGLLSQKIGADDTLDGEDILPGFKLKVIDIFDYPLDPDPEPGIGL